MKLHASFYERERRTQNNSRSDHSATEKSILCTAALVYHCRKTTKRLNASYVSLVVYSLSSRSLAFPSHPDPSEGLCYCCLQHSGLHALACVCPFQR